MLNTLTDERVADNIELPCIHTDALRRLELELIGPVVTLLSWLRKRHLRDLHRRDDNSVELVVRKHKPPPSFAKLKGFKYINTN